MKRSILVCSMIVWTVLSFSQKELPHRQPYADIQKYHFGFHVGIHLQDLLLTHVIEREHSGWFAELPAYSPGISVGILADRRISPVLNIRFSPTIHLGTKKITFREFDNGNTFYQTVSSGYLQLPLDMKYSSVRLNNYRPYLIGGIYGLCELGGKVFEDIRMKSWDYGISIGIGCDFYFHRVKLCPELKFCFGMVNVWNQKAIQKNFSPEESWKNAIFKAKNRLVIFTFNFE